MSTTWAPGGCRPVLRRMEAERRGLSTAVGLSVSGKIYTRHFAGSMDSEDVIAALQYLRRQMPEGWVLVWDRASIHKSKRTRAFLEAHPEIRVEVLPAYAPDLNPEEFCHGHIKQQLRNATPADTVQARQMLNQGFARLRRRPDLLLHFFHAAQLTVRQLW